MGRVALEGIEFHAFHGVFAEENRLGNRFTVDIHVETDFRNAMLEDKLEDTVDYVGLYKIAESQMQQPVKLLEHLAHLMINEIRISFPSIKSVSITIKKHNPALGGLVKYSVVTVKYPEDYE